MKRRTLKSVLGLFLAATMMFGIVGCGAKEEATEAPASEAATEEVAEETKDPVTLEWYYRGNGPQTDTEKVEAAVNELLKDYPGLEHVTLNLQPFTSSDYKQQVQLSQASGTQMDIVSSVSLSSFTTEVANGTWMPIEDYISDELKATLPDWLWEMATVDGHIYMVPTYQRAMNWQYMITPKEWMDAYGDYDKIYSTMTSADATFAEKMDVLEEYIAAIQAGEGETHYTQSWNNALSGTGSNGYPFSQPFDTLANRFIVFEGTDEVVYQGTTDFAKECYAKFAEFRDKGIMDPEALEAGNGNYDTTNMMNDISFAVTFHEQIGSAERVSEIYSTNYGFEVYCIPVQQYSYVTYSWAAGGLGVSSTCENPEEAMTLIEAVTTGTELGTEIYNTLVFGLEDVHYTRSAEDPERIETLEYSGAQGGVDTSYAAYRWVMGNTFNAWKNQAILDDDEAIALEYNNSPETHVSELVGFAPDLSSVQSNFDQVMAVQEEYLHQLLTGQGGVDGWEAMYEEYAAKLEAAGVDIVIEELQKQLDEFNSQK